MVHLGGAVAMCGVLAAAYFVGIRSRLDAQTMTATIEQQIASRTGDAHALEQELATLEEEVRTLRRRADETFDLQPVASRNALLAELGDLIRAAGITVDEMIPTGDEEKDGLVRVTIRLRAHGRLTDLLAFMRTLQRDRPDIGVRTLEVRGEPFREDADQTFSVQIVWYADPADDAGQKTG